MPFRGWANWIGAFWFDLTFELSLIELECLGKLGLEQQPSTWIEEFSPRIIGIGR